MLLRTSGAGLSHRACCSRVHLSKNIVARIQLGSARRAFSLLAFLSHSHLALAWCLLQRQKHEPFKWFPDCVATRITWLKPGVNEKNCEALT